MTSPPDPPGTPQPPPGAPEPPDPGQPGTGTPPEPPAPPGGSQGPPEGESVEELKAALAGARRDLRKVTGDLDKLKRQGMTEAEQAIAAAREEGKAEAMRAQGLKVAAAEFRALAAGRFADPAAAAQALDLARYVGDDGEVDSAELAKAVDALAAATAPNGTPPARVPAGPRTPAGAEEGDAWLRAAARRP